MHQRLLPSMPDYQLRVPRSIPVVLVIGALSGILGVFLIEEGQPVLAVVFLVVALFVITNPNGRERALEHMIGAVDWRGSEQVLDVGCGNGIVMLAAARHLT